MSDSARRRLSSWKEISAYVRRDIRTVSRWEKERGFPVRRLPGGGRSVFAYTDEIDDWLTGGGAEEPAAAQEPAVVFEPALPPAPAVVVDPAPVPVPTPTAMRAAPWWRRRPVSLLPAAVAAIAVAVWAPRMWSSPEAVAQIDVQGRDVVGLTADAVEVWRHTLSHPARWPAIHPRYGTPDLDRDGKVDIVTVIGTPTPPGQDREALYAFDGRGRLKWQRTLSDVARFRDGVFEGPWLTNAVTAVRMHDAWRVIWATHHHTWWPSSVAMFDAKGEHIGSFFHAGWVTSAAGGPDGKVVLVGAANHADADMIAVLDAQSWPGAAPQPVGTGYECLDCPPGRPVRYYLMPRSELNRRPDSLRPNAQIHVFDARIEVRIPHDDASHPAENIYELAPDYTLRRVRQSDSTPSWHRRLESAGVIKHAYEACPERRGVTVREWKRDGGWSEYRIPGAH